MKTKGMKLEVYYSNKEYSIFLIREFELYYPNIEGKDNPIIQVRTLNDNIPLSYDLNDDKYYHIKLDDVKFYEYIAIDDSGNKIEYIRGKNR